MPLGTPTTLPVAAVESGGHLVASDGSPVWPLRHLDHQVALGRVAAVFGACLEHVPAAHGQTRPLGDEQVVSLGSDAAPAGSLYGHLTQRRFRALPDLASLALEDRPAVVVTTPEHLTTQLLDWLYNGPGPSAPGIICGDRGDPLLRQVLVRSAAATLCGPLELVRTDVFPTLPIATVRVPGLEILGSSSTAAERRRAVTEGTGVLTVMTHSDGVDAFMGDDLTICPMDRVADDLPLDRSPRCRLTGQCHRHAAPVARVLSTNAVLPPDEITTRVLVWDVCFGVMPAGSVVDPPWGIGTLLLGSPSIGAILTTWRIVLSSPEHVRGVSHAIASGVPLGPAVHQFNSSDVSRSRHHRMCLLGDPRLRLPARAESGQDPALPESGSEPPASDGRQLQELALVRLCLADAKKRASAGARAALAAEALDAVEAFEAAASKGVPIETLPTRLGDEMRRALLDYAMSRGKLLENWMPFAERYRAGTFRRCGVCGRRADTIEAAMRPPGVSARRLVLCAICGVLDDAPVTSDIRLELAGRRLLLHGTLPRERWAAKVLMASSDPTDSIQLAWPANADETPATSMELPPRWPPGPLRLSVAIAWDTSFALVSRMARDRGPETCR